jgi:hypothetical protein
LLDSSPDVSPRHESLQLPDRQAQFLECKKHTQPFRAQGAAFDPMDMCDAFQLFGLYTLTAWTMTVSMNLEYQWHVQAPALKDLGFQMLFELPAHFHEITEHMLHSMLVFSIAGAFFNYSVPSAVSQIRPRWDLICTWLRCMAVLNLLRTVSFLVTQLPGPAEHCRPGSPTYNPPKTVFERASFQKGCGDLLFSGHTMTLTTCAMLLDDVLSTASSQSSTWSQWRRRILRAALWLYVLLFAVLVVAARKHYTVDVLVALYTAPLVYNRFSQGWFSKGNKGQEPSIDKEKTMARIDGKKPRPSRLRVTAVVATLMLSAWLWLHLSHPTFREHVSLPVIHMAAWLVSSPSEAPSSVVPQLA